MKIINVILSGGLGSRLWPLSRTKSPKQYLKIFNGKSLFDFTLERNHKIADGIIVVANKNNTDLSEESALKLNLNVTNIIEAIPRNTAAAIAFAAFAAEKDDILIVTPSDHIIEDEHEYQKSIREAISLAEEGYIVTFGILASRAETGYGYIEYEGNDVVSFREKPNAETAKSFLKKGNFLWNSGMFCFKAGLLLDELKNFEPEIYEKVSATWLKNADGILDETLSLEIPSKSIDYAVMERSEKIKVLPVNFRWSDLGSFESVYEYLKSIGHKVDKNGNMVIGTDIYTEFLGLENTIFVSTDNANLILQKNHSQGVKDIFMKLESEGSHLLN